MSSTMNLASFSLFLLLISVHARDPDISTPDLDSKNSQSGNGTENPPDAKTKIIIGEIQCAPSTGELLQSPIKLGRIGSKTEVIKGEIETLREEKENPDEMVQFYGNNYYGKNRDRFYVHNDGETYSFQFDPNEPTSEMTIISEGWEDEYVLAKGRFHWGSNSSDGSEHIVHGRKFPLELQLIHYGKSHKTLEAARGKKDGVIILSILYELDEEKPNPALNALIQGASSVYFPGPMKQVHGPVQLKSLFPLHMAYYEYPGSFTSPPCDDGVKWIVFEEPQILTTSQLRKLRKLMLANEEPMVDNFRPIQPMKDRSIKYSGPAIFSIQLKTSLKKTNEALRLISTSIYLLVISLAIAS